MQARSLGSEYLERASALFSFVVIGIGSYFATRYLSSGQPGLAIASTLVPVLLAAPLIGGQPAMLVWRNPVSRLDLARLRP
jgi:hypothetical protein